MKPEEIIAGIIKNSGYDRLVKLCSSENGNGEHLPSKEIIEIFCALDKKIDIEKKSFLRSFGLRPREPHTNIIDFKVSPDIQDAKDEFDRELKKQMPTFIQLINKIPAEDLIPESIAV